MRRWRPADIIALVIIVCLFVLKCLGHDSALSWSVLGVVVGYYGVDVTVRTLRKKRGDD